MSVKDALDFGDDPSTIAGNDPLVRKGKERSVDVFRTFIKRVADWWLRRLVERPREAYLWGQRRTITPRLVTQVFGDGGMLLALEPTDTRPNYYVVRVPSELVTSNWSSGEPHIADLLNDILEAIKDEYGSATCHTCGGYIGKNEPSDCEECHGLPEAEFPALFDDTGVGWGELEWPTWYPKAWRLRSASDPGAQTERKVRDGTQSD